MSAVAVRATGRSGRRWDLWQSEERVDTDQSWVGLIKEQIDGSFWARLAATGELLGPFQTFDDAKGRVTAESGLGDDS